MARADVEPGPGGLETVVVEVEVAAVAGRVEAIEAGAVREQAEVGRQVEGLREQAGDAVRAVARPDVALAVQRVVAAGVGGPVGRAAGHPPLGLLSLPRPPLGCWVCCMQRFCGDLLVPPV
nr:hypothetical protein [Halochromatium glycolicum]